MGSLSASLNIATQSMLAEQGAIETTTNNIATGLEEYGGLVFTSVP